VNPFPLLGLFAFFTSQAFVAAQIDLIPFGSAFPPTFTFSETYKETVKFSTAEDDFVDQTLATLTCKARASMQGLDLSVFTNEASLLLDVGNLSLNLVLGEGTRSIVDGMNVVRWQLDGTDPDTGDIVPNACTVTLRYDATELIVQVTSSNVPDDFSIMAPDEAGTEENVEAVPLPFDFSVGRYGLSDRICYVSGTSALYDTVVNGEPFTDLANVNLTGELDSENPNVKIVQPQAGASVDTATIEVSGIVTDNYVVAFVEVSLNGGPFVLATLENDGSWHLAGVTPLPGLNSLIARAEDESGNEDTSAVRTFEYTPRSKLTVAAEGNAPGRVSAGFITTLDFRPAQPPQTAQADLLIGKDYTLIATPGADALFDHWTSNASLTPAQATSPRLVFTMTENLTLTAHFVINPFIPVQGTYAGLLSSADSVSTGFLSGKLTHQGAFSLKAKVGELTLPIKGRFSLDGHFTGRIVVADTSYAIELTLNVTGIGTRTITGTIVGGKTSVTIMADLSPFEKKDHPVPAELVGTFNFIVPPNSSVTDPNYPVGIGFGRVTVSTGGTARFTGKVADGTAVSGSAPLSSESRWPLFSSLYRGGGSISGWVTFDRSQVDHDLGGTLDWKKPRGSGSAIHAEGFAGKSDLSGARCEGLTSFLALSLSNNSSELTLQSPGVDPFPLNISLPFPLRTGRITVTAPSGSTIKSITCKVQAKTGLLSGNVVEAGAVRKIQGILVQSKLNRAGGFVLRDGYSTALKITPPAAH
jgi:Divergent InlB B-repeat domain/Bacterial Ig domain